MKSVVNVENAKAEKPFPKLMISESGRIVLFSKLGCGTVLREPEVETAYSIGHYSDTWSLTKFTDFNGTVTLSND